MQDAAMQHFDRHFNRPPAPFLALWSLCVVAICSWAASTARAQVSAGTQTVNTGNGMQVTVDTRWPGGHGYRPVRVEVKSLAPVTNDRTLLVELHCYSMHYKTGTFDISQFIEVPAGVDMVQATVAVPEHFSVGSFACDIHEDGRFRRALSIKETPAWGVNAQGWEETLPAVLLVGDQAPDTVAWVQLFPNSVNARNWAGNTVVGTNPAYSGALALPESYLPRRWIDYSGLDIVCLSLAQVESLATSHQETWTAIRRWTCAGGNLWIYGIGADWQGLEKLERRLEMPELPAAEPPQRRGWSSPGAVGRSSVLVGIDQNANQAAGTVWTQTPTGQMVATSPAQVEPQPPAAPAQAPPANTIEPHFASRRLALGLVVAIADEQPFPGDSVRWGWVFNHVTPSRYLWSKRHGFSRQGDNPDFWTWFITGVGIAPVGTFIALISLFVIFIGPVNYWWLRRRGKLHLMLVTVPVCAMLVTGTLFGYALIADGLSVRTRLRSYTEIDQQRGEAVCWTRGCYYAALSPAGGLLMPDDVLVLPYEDISQFYEYNNSVHRTLDWTDEGQRLSRGWLPARNQTQYITVRSRATPARLNIAPAAAPATGWRVENQLGSKVQRLLVVAPDGTAWTAANLLPEGTASLETADLQSEVRAFQTAISDNAKTSLPPEVRADELVASRRSGSRFNRFGYYGNTSDVRLTGGRLEVSLLESVMAEPRGGVVPQADDSLPAAAAYRLRQIGPRMYLALVDQSPETVVGVEGSRQEDSLHVIVGRW